MQNIHELIFPISEPGENQASSKRGEHHSSPGITFELAAWWSPSYVERDCVERALWQLMICWNLVLINPRLKRLGDPRFIDYGKKIQRFTGIYRHHAISMRY